MSAVARDGERASELYTLFALLRAERLPLGVEEMLRLTHLLTLGEGLNRSELEELVACVIARSSEERDACRRALSVWFERESAWLDHALTGPGPEVVEPTTPDDVPEPLPTPAVEPRALLPAPIDDPDRPAVRPSATPPVDRRLLIAAAAASVSALVVGALSRPPDGGRSVVPGLATLVLAAITTATLALTTRRRPWLSAPSVIADREALLDLPPPPPVLKNPALLDRRTRDHLVEGVGSYVTEHLTRSLDARRTIHTTVKTAGLPQLIFREAREGRTVWLWVDDTARDGLMDRTVREVHQTLSLEGIRAEVILYRAIPALTGLRALPLTREGFARGPYRRLAADDVDAQRSNGIVALLTDGRELSLAAQGARKRQVHRALAALRGFSRLAVVDFGCGKSSLGELSEAHDLSLIRPEQLAAFLSGLTDRLEALDHSSPIRERPVMTWAAVCSLSPRPVDEATAHALREYLGLAATPWSIGALIHASDAGGRVWLPSSDRAQLVYWLWSSDLDGLHEKGPFRRALRFWREHFQTNPVDEALLGLWESPEAADAAAVLWAWSETPLGRRIRLEVGGRAPLPEGGGLLGDPRGKLVLPWRLTELPPEARWRLRELGLGHVEKAPAKEWLRFPGTAALAMGWSAGIGVGALLSLTGSWVGALGGGVALAIVVYGVVRRFALRLPAGAVMEEGENEPEVETSEAKQPLAESKPEPDDIVTEPAEAPAEVLQEDPPPPAAPILDTHTDVLLVTVTKPETEAVLEAFGNAAPVVQSIYGRIYFDLGNIRGARVRLTRTEMGAGGLGGAQYSITKVIAALSPQTVILVGIAFGINEQKLQIGDILVSEQVRLYEHQRVGSAESNIVVVVRKDKLHAANSLVNRYQSADLTWTGATAHFGTLLTGDKLVDTLDYRNALRGLDPEVIGGDMESVGLCQACHDAEIDWILIKGICDWVDGIKGEDKKARQALAAKNAAEFVLHGLRVVESEWSPRKRRYLTPLPPRPPLSGAERREFLEALLSAFPTRRAVARVVSFRLNMNLDHITSDDMPLTATVFELLRVAESGGWEEQLLKAAIAEVPESLKLREFAQRWRA